MAERKAPPKSWVMFDEYLTLGGFGRVEREFRFHPTRRWRFDWYLPEQGEHGIAFEYDGLMSGHASHASIGGILRDSEKINESLAMGIPVYRVNAKFIQDGRAFSLAERVLTSNLDLATVL